MSDERCQYNASISRSVKLESHIAQKVGNETDVDVFLFSSLRDTISNLGFVDFIRYKKNLQSKTFVRDVED